MRRRHRLHAAIVIAIAPREWAGDLARQRMDNRLQAERPDGSLGHGLVPGFSGHVFNDRAEHHIAAIIIFPRMPRLRFRGHIAGDGEQLGSGKGAGAVLRDPPRYFREVLNARRVVGELANGRLRARLRPVGEETRDRVVERHLAVRDQLQDCRRGELLDDGAQRKRGVRRDRLPLFNVGKPPARRVDDLAAAGDDHRRAGPVGGISRGDNRSDPGLKISGRHFCRLRRSRARCHHQRQRRCRQRNAAKEFREGHAAVLRIWVRRQLTRSAGERHEQHLRFR
ncbi:MAG: hypothetical protein WKF52_08105 [Sphingomicrobium sp.]